MESFAITRSGELLIANGIDPMLRWDGFSGEAIPAGLEYPTKAVNIKLHPQRDTDTELNKQRYKVKDSTFSYLDYTTRSIVTREFRIKLTKGSDKAQIPEDFLTGLTPAVVYYYGTHPLAGSSVYTVLSSLPMVLYPLMPWESFVYKRYPNAPWGEYQQCVVRESGSTNSATTRPSWEQGLGDEIRTTYFFSAKNNFDLKITGNGGYYRRALFGGSPLIDLQKTRNGIPARRVSWEYDAEVKKQVKLNSTATVEEPLFSGNGIWLHLPSLDRVIKITKNFWYLKPIAWVSFATTYVARELGFARYENITYQLTGKLIKFDLETYRKSYSLLSAPWDGPTGEYSWTLYLRNPVPNAGEGPKKVQYRYRAYVRFGDDKNRFSAFSPISEEVVSDFEPAKFEYNNVPVPTSPYVTKRQILRNTNGQYNVFYVDVDTTDLTSTTLTSEKKDNILSGMTALPLVSSQGVDLTTRDFSPPSTIAVLCSHADRIFGAGATVYSEGCVRVVHGSDQVEGIGTRWPATLRGRQLWVGEYSKPYEIKSVDVAKQVITLIEPYRGGSMEFCRYAIRPYYGLTKMVAFSAAGRPESWPPLNALTLPEDGDVITALIAHSSYLFVAERKHLYRLTFGTSPNEDGGLFLHANRGCINDRCWLNVDGNLLMLDDQGIYAVTGRQGIEPYSDVINDLFAHGRGPYRIHWDNARYFHACFDSGHKVARWFVSLSSSRYPRHALCFSISLSRWWLEEYPFPITASCEALVGNQRRVVLAGLGKMFVLEPGRLELVDDGVTVAGTITARGRMWLQDSSGQFSQTLPGTTLGITSGRGRRQVRIVTRVSGSRIYVDRPWRVLPQVGDHYQIGAISWAYKTGLLPWAPGDRNSPRRIEVRFTPKPAEFWLQLYRDRSDKPVVWGYTLASDEASGMASIKGSADLVGDASKPDGFLQKRIDGHRDAYLDGHRVFAIRLDGVQPVRFSGLQIDGAVAKKEQQGE